MKITIRELEDYVYNLTPITISPSVKELLRISTTESYVKVMSSLIRATLKDFELKRPLRMYDRTINVPNTLNAYSGQGAKYTFIDNYQAYLDGILGEDKLELIPTAIVSYSHSLMVMPRRFDYIPPTAKFKNGGGKIMINYLARYPYVLKSTNDDEFTGDSHIYGINEEMGSAFHFFTDLLLFNIFNYLKTQKNQLSYTDLPMDILNSIDENMSELKERVTEWYNSSVWHSDLLV